MSLVSSEVVSKLHFESLRGLRKCACFWVFVKGATAVVVSLATLRPCVPCAGFPFTSATAGEQPITHFAPEGILTHTYTHSQMREHTHTWLTLGLRALSEPMCQLWALLPSVEYIYLCVCRRNEHFVQYSWVFLQLWAILVMWSFLPLNYLLCLTEFCSVNNIFNINKNGIKCLCSLDKLHC